MNSTEWRVPWSPQGSLVILSSIRCELADWAVDGSEDHYRVDAHGYPR